MTSLSTGQEACLLFSIRGARGAGARWANLARVELLSLYPGGNYSLGHDESFLEPRLLSAPPKVHVKGPRKSRPSVIFLFYCQPSYIVHNLVITKYIYKKETQEALMSFFKVP